MIPKKTLARLLVAALVLPIGLCVVWGIAHLLGAMGDALWAKVLARVALIGTILWVIDLVCLLVALGVHAMGPADGSNDSTSD